MVVEKRDMARVGKAMYEEMRADMEANHWGCMVVIDVNTGEYEVADDDLTATLRLMERVPGAMTWGELIGYPAPYHMSQRVAFTPHDQGLGAIRWRRWSSGLGNDRSRWQ